MQHPWGMAQGPTNVAIRIYVNGPRAPSRRGMGLRESLSRSGSGDQSVGRR